MMDNNAVVKDRDQDSGQITYANEVISTIVTVATTEVEGISGIVGANGSISGIIAKGKTAKGVKVDVDGKDINVDLSVIVDYGMPIQKVGRNAQENVRKSIETMTGLHVEKVDLHVVGVSFEKENQELQQSQQLALTIEEEKETVAHDDASALKAVAEPETLVVETQIVADEPAEDEASTNGQA